MIVARIMGGLGNQLFAYAFGLFMARKAGVELVLDASWFADELLRGYMLDRYNISAPLADSAVRRRFIRRYGGRGALGYLRGERPLKRVKERVFGFRPEYLEAGDDVYLDGYWQSEKFFPGMMEQLRAEFQPVVPLSDETLAVARRMAAGQSASLHVRRTDYLDTWFTTVCSEAYYQRAVEHLLSRYEGLRLFVFSDDAEWCRRELRFPCGATFVTHNDAATAHEDLWLMSQCRHHVVANSTFSWWAARLGVDPTGETIAPDPWFSHPDMDGSAVIPAWWKVISREHADKRAA